MGSQRVRYDLATKPYHQEINQKIEKATKNAVQSFEFSDNVLVLCYNADSRDWVTLEQAKAYSNTMDLYVHNGIVRVIEVRH